MAERKSKAKATGQADAPAEVSPLDPIAPEIELKPHPLSEPFPRLTGDDFDALFNDIGTRGVLNPVTLFEGMVLDGRGRVAVARQQRIPCPAQEYVGPDPLGFVIAQNVLRQHLTTGQRIMIAARIANMRQGERTDLEPSAHGRKVSQEAAARMLKVGTKSVERGAYILKHGNPEEIEAACQGKEHPRNVAERIKARIDEVAPQPERDNVDRADDALMAAQEMIGTFRRLHIDLTEIMNRLVERENGDRLERYWKLLDEHRPAELFADAEVKLKDAIARLAELHIKKAANA
jgi:hypothetical protein